jgi:hypothetical protein
LAGDHTGPVDVTVTTVVGISPTGVADKYNYGLSITGLSPPTGPAAGGTVVTITGSGFGSPGASDIVEFGTTPGTGVNVVSDSSITVTSPAGSGTVDVTVQATSGTSPVNQPADQFSYTAAATPAGLGIQIKTGTGTPLLSCGTIGSSYTCNITGVGSDGSATYYVQFVTSSGLPVVFSTTTSSTITDPNGTPTSLVIPANAATSSPSSITQSDNLASTTTNTLTFTSGATSFTMTVTVSP